MRLIGYQCNSDNTITLDMEEAKLPATVKSTGVYYFLNIRRHDNGFVFINTDRNIINNKITSFVHSFQGQFPWCLSEENVFKILDAIIDYNNNVYFKQMP